LRHGKSKDGIPEEVSPTVDRVLDMEMLISLQGRAQDSKKDKKSKKVAASRNSSPEIRMSSPSSTKSP
jgi:hypothetical protein